LHLRILTLLVFLLFLLNHPVLAQSPQRGLAIAPQSGASGSWGDYHALIIGINDYAKWPRLQTAVKDATVIKETLISRYGFQPDNVILRTDRKASRLQIIEDLRYLAQSMGVHDNLFVYYAGHGQLDDFTGDGYWVPAEGALKNPGTWVANSYIKAVLSSEKLQAKNVVVIADSCYSGSMLRGGPSLMSLNDRRYKEKLVQKASLRSRQVISSGGVEPVADGGAEGHSLFAYYLIDALRKNDREVIDLENLFHTRVWTKVTEIGDQRPNVGRLKTPMDQDGQFVLYNTAWAAEHARKHTALEAERQQQDRTRKQAAVAQAELELQRQRFEIEKQKLALEKEQLAQQKTIELEKLKLEQQKQEIEYAKLQARLEDMKRKPQETAPPVGQQMVAAVSPPVKNQPGALNRKASREEYKLAILPQNLYASTNDDRYLRSYQLASIQAVANVTFDDDRLKLTHGYEEFEDFTEGVTILSDITKNDVWKKKSIFSRLKPDWEEVNKLNLKIDVDLVLMIEGEIYPGSFTFYLYDLAKAKIYSKNFRPAWLAYPNSVEGYVRSLMKDYFKNQ